MQSSRPSPRPRFELRTSLSPSEVRRRVNALIDGSTRVRGIAFDHRIELAIGGDEHHFWSPQLIAIVSPTEGGGAHLLARFGPDPYVWALYLLSYSVLVVVTLFALMFGLVEWWLGQPPIALFVAPAAGILAGLVYGASFVGQGLGAEQMYFLRVTLKEVTSAEDVRV